MSADTSQQIRPLTGVRVLDLGRHLAGPTAAMWLGDLGADVIKVEAPGRGDSGRQSGPPFFEGESAFFLSANRNKRSIALDLKREKGQQVFRRLASVSDVLIENFRPGVMEALNIGYERLSGRNKRIVYCAITGFGIDGPQAQRPGLDQIVQGTSGLMSVTGLEESEPVRVGIPIADLLAGLFAAYGVLAALQSRERTGRGQRVDTSLMESMVGMMNFQAVRYLNGGGSPGRAGNHHPILAPYGVFRALDGHLTLGAVDDKSWCNLCEAIDAPELLDDPRFDSNGKRFAAHDELADLITGKLQSRTASEWMGRLNEAGIPCGLVKSVAEALEDEQVIAREMIVERDHPTVGLLRLLGLPVKLSATPGGVDRVPPLLGEQSDEILIELGFSSGEIRKLRQESIIGPMIELSS